MFWVFVTLLWTAMLLCPFMLLYLFLPAGSDCPRCDSDTIAIRSSLLAPVRKLASFRWCLGCGWQGVTRSAVLTRPLPRLEVVPEDRDEADEAPWRL